MLTIVGYSINATIVIFDRIRENMKGSRSNLEEIVNESITQTLTRSMYTSFTTFVMVAVLYIMGVSSIREFAAPLMVGVICGAYSSVCITGALWLVMKRYYKKPVAQAVAAKNTAAPAKQNNNSQDTKSGKKNSDLSRLTGELEKLIITLPAGQRRVTPEQIEKNIGISKDYNNFELRSALVEKDILKANKIIKYFEENPKTNPIQMTLSLLFNFYSNLMLAYYAPDKSEQGVANMLGLKTTWQAKDYIAAMRKYTGVKTMQIVGEIRYADAKSKGVKNSSMTDGDILRELVFNILH